MCVYKHSVYVGLTEKSRSGEKLGYCLQVVFGCLIQWSDQSKSFRTTMLKEGLVFENVNMLGKLGSAIGNEVRMCVVLLVYIQYVFPCELFVL